MLRGKVGHRRSEDGHHKMGAHEAGRVACHASSLEWAVKLATCTFLSMKTSAFLGAFFYFEKWGWCACKSGLLSAEFLKFTFDITVFAENRITPPSPHCLRLWSVLPCCVASRTVFCCRDRLQFTDETLQGEYVVGIVTYPGVHAADTGLSFCNTYKMSHLIPWYRLLYLIILILLWSYLFWLLLTIPFILCPFKVCYIICDLCFMCCCCPRRTVM